MHVVGYKISRKPYAQGVAVSCDISTAHTHVFGSTSNKVNEQMKISLDKATSFPLVAQEEEYQLHFSFYHSNLPGKDGDAEAPAEHQTPCSKIRVVKASTLDLMAEGHVKCAELVQGQNRVLAAYRADGRSKQTHSKQMWSRRTGPLALPLLRLTYDMLKFTEKLKDSLRGPSNAIQWVDKPVIFSNIPSEAVFYRYRKQRGVNLGMDFVPQSES
ncbi:hypothetical protein H0H81_011944 [Sphagnurus paluster]|uniref:Uncharacterized protein n=1 Tax=Sphagnurus paluster TaxID=117069 RepID=A0A9P7K283_9AGAR|nr:hypothetical protein H0H81_011944 [Sphagnurus paluster]